jgi:hypothetical protein
MSWFTSSPDKNEVNPPLLWFAALGGVTAWAVHLMVVYPLVHVACDLGSDLSLHVVSAVTLVIAIVSTVVAWKIWKDTGASMVDSLRGEAGRTPFMSLGGFAFGLMMILGIIYGWIPIFVLDACA